MEVVDDSRLERSWDSKHDRKWAEGRGPAQWVIGFLQEHCDQTHDEILDLGCGWGRNMIPLIKQGYTVTGSDISREGLDRARTLLDRDNIHAELFQGPCNELPFPDGSFGGVLSVGVIQHNNWQKIVQTIQEVSRVLKEGGHFVWKARGLGYWCEQRIRVSDDHGYLARDTEGDKVGVDQHYFTEDEVRLLAQKCGFALAEEPFETRMGWSYKRGLKVHWNAVYQKK